MDVEIKASEETVTSLLSELSFSLAQKEAHISATRPSKSGRLHVLVKSVGEGVVFCDIHHDATIHFLFLGVDYDKKPSEFYENELKVRLLETGIEHCVLNGKSWFTRKNRALIRGIRL